MYKAVVYSENHVFIAIPMLLCNKFVHAFVLSSCHAKRQIDVFSWYKMIILCRVHEFPRGKMNILKKIVP
jgi:hypothetical protein